MTGKPPHASIVIRAYNEAKHLGRLLQGIAQQTVQDVEVILVDSGSTDATVDIARSFGARVVAISPQEFTFGRALNRGIRVARGEFIVIASAHVYPVYPDWLERLLEPFQDPQVALTYGKQRGHAVTKFSEHQIFAVWFPDGQGPRYQDHPFCNNANAAIRRRLWEQHPYDETLPGLEDLAWAKWALEQGYAVVYVPEAEIVHIHEETWRQVYNRYRREAMAFKQIYPHSRFSWWDFLRLWWSNVWHDWQAARRQGAWRRYWWEIVLFRFWQFLGTYQGHRLEGPLTAQLRRTFYYPGQRTWDAGPGRARAVPPLQYQDAPVPSPQGVPDDVGAP